MKKVIALTILFAFVIAVLPAEASTPLDVTIEAVMDPFPAMTGTFVAYGPAVDEERFCPSGTIEDQSVRAMAYQSEIRLNLHMLKKFTCDDGSGTIDIALNVKVVYSAGYSWSNWVIKNGTGDYSRLHGTGGIIAVGDEQGYVYDTYTGQMQPQFYPSPANPG